MRKRGEERSYNREEKRREEREEKRRERRERREEKRREERRKKSEEWREMKDIWRPFSRVSSHHLQGWRTFVQPAGLCSLFAFFYNL